MRSGPDLVFRWIGHLELAALNGCAATRALRRMATLATVPLRNFVSVVIICKRLSSFPRPDLEAIQRLEFHNRPHPKDPGVFQRNTRHVAQRIRGTPAWMPHELEIGLQCQTATHLVLVHSREESLRRARRPCRPV